MLSRNIKYQTKEDLIKLKREIPPADFGCMLIQAFCGIPEEAVVSRLLSELIESFPGCPILGTTTAGEIMDGHPLDNSIIINVTRFDHTRIKTSLAVQNEDLYLAGEQLADEITRQDTRLVLLFGCGIKNGGAINGEPLLSAFKKKCPHAVVGGGQAGDNGVAKQTFVFTETGYTDRGVAAAALSGDRLSVNNHYNLSWVPLGKKMTITHSEGTRIFTIDGRSAKEIYAHYLGEDISNRLPASAAEFPLVVERSGVLLARHANWVHSDGSLDFMAPFKAGETVRFAFCHSGLLAMSARDTFDAQKPLQNEVFFIYSCLTRKWVLGEDARVELAPLASLAPTSGFFSYGEYFSGQEENLFLSQTMTLIGLSESSAKPDSPPTPIFNNIEFQEHASKQTQNLKALHRLVETSAQEREALIKELREALSEIKTLRGFIPICAHCKNIRDDKGYWNEIERYIQAHTEVQFSHSLCPDCIKTYYPNLRGGKK